MNLEQYLSERVGKVVLDSDKVFNTGASLLAAHPTWKEDLGAIIGSSWDTLAKFCIRSRGNTYSASVKLTLASTAIGQRICKKLEIEPTLKNQIGLGDLIIETFLQEGLVDVYREYAGIKAPYMVRIVKMINGIKPTLIGTSFDKPEPLYGLFSKLTGESYIKGWSDNAAFKEIINTDHIKSVEKLRQTGWSINTAVLRVLNKNAPPSCLTLVDRDGVIHEYSLDNEPPRVSDDMHHMDGTLFLGRQDAKLQRIISKHFEYNQIISKAKMVLERGNKFWQEVSCDYRGREYYAESFLEYQGSDNARSLFLFQEPFVVTERGMFWFYVHAANSYNESFTVDQLKKERFAETDYSKHLEDEGLDTISVDKMTIQDRYNWTQSRFNKILDWGREASLRDEAEKPYALLAVCIEIFKAHLCKVQGIACQSQLPIPIDGSNNGWQHLAAISKDKEAGELVSLTKTVIQKDFYVAVAKDLIKLMPAWFEEKNMPMKHIRKGISKRGSMTRAYSAGKKRIAKNMYDDCHVEGFSALYGITEADTETLSGNLINAINHVCAGPLKTTKYLQKMAEYVLNQGRNTITWLSPSGFPVVYKAYLQREDKQRGTIRGIKGSKDGRIMHVVRVDVTGKAGEKVPCRRSFASGIAPNYIHSLDAAHMAKTIVAFPGSFAAVHDSFATHASMVDMLQEVTKEEFVKQYDVDNYFDIIKENLIGDDTECTVVPPELGILKIKEVMNSDYFFC